MKQLVAYLAMVLLWVMAIGLFAVGQAQWLLILLLVLHFVEYLLVGSQVANAWGLSPLRGVALSMLFGFFWWLPLRQKMALDDQAEKALQAEGAQPAPKAVEP